MSTAPAAASPSGRLTVSLVGSTGSIGTQAFDVVTAQPERFEVVALAARRSTDTLLDQARRLRPQVVAVADDAAARALKEQLPAGTDLVAGPGALEEVAVGADVVLNAVVGFAGLPVTVAALQAGRRLALANKESLIAAAPVVQAVRSTPGAEILPVDSEHCALHQCLRGAAGPEEVARLVLTASGGPFRGRSQAELAEVGVDDALAHPTWRMGPKITVDSSTLMNKGLEVIEAHELFGVGYDQVTVVVHPQSVVHSMVEFCDGATLAQLSRPDMRLCIGYALGYPRRLNHPYGALDFAALGTLEFEVPDRSVFRCLALAEEAGRAGGSVPAWLNAANEVAVEAFLAGRISWSEIAAVVADTVEACDRNPLCDVADVVDADRRARRCAASSVAARQAA